VVVACGLLVIAELLTGTFYLLMLALGAIAGALCAHFGLGTSSQIVAAALLGSGAVLVCYLLRKRSPRDSPPPAIAMSTWMWAKPWSSNSGTPTARPRSATAAPPGLSWDARARCPSGPHRVAEVIGNRLLVDKI
jgi:hypothetical protein